MADPTTDATFDQFLSSTAPAPTPSADASFDAFLHESAPVSARSQLDDYKAGKLDLTDEQVKGLSKIAQDGVGAWQSLGKGVQYIFAHPLKDMVDIGGIAAKGIEGIAGANEALMSPEKQLHADLSAGHPVDAMWNYGMNKFRSAQEISQGALRGITGLAPVLGGAVTEIAQLDAQPFLDKEQQQEFNARTNAGVYQAERLKNLAFNKAASVTGVNPEAPLYAAAENVAPMAIPLGGEEALGSATGKIANAIVDKGTVAAGKVGAPVLQGVKVAAPAAVALATYASHPYLALAELFGGYAGMRGGLGAGIRRVIDAPFDWAINTAKTLASTPEGETVLGSIRAGLDDEAARFTEQLGDTDKFPPDKIKLAFKTRADGVTPKFSPEELSGAAKEYRETQNKIADIQKKSATYQKYEEVNRVLSAGVRTGIKAGLDTGVAGMIGAGFAGSTESPGEYEQARQGFLAGSALGGAAALIHAPVQARNAYRTFLQKELIRQSGNNMAGSPLQESHQFAMNTIPKPAQDYVNSYAAMANANGHNVAVLSPVDFVNALREQEGIDVGLPEKAPYGFYSANNKIAYVRSDALAKGVVPHEVTHALDQATGMSNPISPTGKALDAMLDSKNPEIQNRVKSGENKYLNNILRSIPNMPGDQGFILQGNGLPKATLTREQLKAEILADLGIDLLHQTPPEALYGGRSLFQKATGAIGKMFGQQPTATNKYGFPVTPELREAMADQLFDIGSRLKSRAPAIPGAPVTVESGIPEPVKPPDVQMPQQPVNTTTTAPVSPAGAPAQAPAAPPAASIDPQAIKDAVAGMTALKFNKTDAQARVGQAASEAAHRNLQVTANDLLAHALSGRFPNETSAPPAGSIPGPAVEPKYSDMLWQKALKGEIGELGVPSQILLDAREAIKSGAIKTREDFDQFLQQKYEPVGVTDPAPEPRLSSLLWDKVVKGDVSELGIPSKILLEAREGIREGSIKNQEDFDSFLQEQYGQSGETTEPAPTIPAVPSNEPVRESAGLDRPVQQPGAVQPKDIESAGEEAAQSLKQSNPRATEKEIERARVMAMAEAHTANEPETNLVTHRVDAFGKPGINGTELDPSNPMNKRLIANAGLLKDQVAAANLLLENRGKNVVLRDYSGAPVGEEVSGVSRRSEQAASTAQDRKLDKSEAQTADKNFVPSRIVYNHGSGKNQPSILVRGFSPDKFAHNATQLFPWIEKNGFNVDAKGKQLFTGPDDPKLIERFNDVVQNQSRGYTGNGEKEVEGTPFTSVKPDPDYTPVKIPDEEFHVVNALIGAAPPEVAKTPIQQNTKVLTRLNAPGGEPNPIWAKLGDEKRLLESTIENVKPELIGSIDTSNAETPKAIRTTAKLQGAPRQDFSAAGFLPQDAPESLRDTAKELGLRYEGISLAGKAHAFTDEKTGSTIDIPKDATPDDLRMEIGMSRKQFTDNKQPLFQPSDHEDAIEGAAVKMPDGRIFKATVHPEALVKAMEYYRTNEEPNKFNHWLESGDWEDGFTTKKGQFLDRMEAMAHAKEIGQLTKRGYAGASKTFDVLDKKQPGLINDQNLESLRFDHARAFLPSDNPLAIAGLATKTEDGKIHVGAYSGNQKGTEGFIDNSGAFLTRGAALKQAEELGLVQKTGDMLPNEPEDQPQSKPSSGLTVSPFTRAINPTRKDDKEEPKVNFPIGTTVTDYNTPLSDSEEKRFEKWKEKYAPKDSGDDYDLRGAFKAGLTPSENGHWPDTFKKPNHETFSDESVYAKDAPDKAGHWSKEVFTRPINLRKYRELEIAPVLR